MSKWQVLGLRDDRADDTVVEADSMTIEQNGALVFWVVIPETGLRNLHQAFSHDAWKTVARL